MAKDTLKNKAYNYLYQAIISHELLPGAPIVEQEISEILGISRTPVREALKQLESEGLVRSISARGTFVSEVNIQDVEEIFALREALEVLALHTAINEITDQEIQEMETLLEVLSASNNAEHFYDSDRKLHDLIVRSGRNRRLMNFLKNLNAQIERLRYISAMRPNRLKASQQEHLAIVHAMKERNLEKAEALLRQHIRNVKENTIEVCRNMWLKQI